MNREYIIDLFSLDMKYYDSPNGTKVFYSDYDSITQQFCFRRVIRDLGFQITLSEKIVDDDDEILERHFVTNITIQQFDEMESVHENYIWSNEIIFYHSSESSNPEQEEPQN